MSENQKRIKRQKKEQARQDIRLIKEKARNDVLQISYNLKRSLVHDNPVKLTSLSKRKKRKEREEKRDAYESCQSLYYFRGNLEFHHSRHWSRAFDSSTCYSCCKGRVPCSGLYESSLCNRLFCVWIISYTLILNVNLISCINPLRC